MRNILMQEGEKKDKGKSCSNQSLLFTLQVFMKDRD